MTTIADDILECRVKFYKRHGFAPTRIYLGPREIYAAGRLSVVEWRHDGPTDRPKVFGLVVYEVCDDDHIVCAYEETDK